MNLVDVLFRKAAKKAEGVEEDIPEDEDLEKEVVNALGDQGYQLLKAGLTHENNLVGRWCFSNASIAKNGNGEIKLVKEHKGRSVDRTKRIDLMTALVNAMARAQFYKGHVDVNAMILEDEWGM